jgi:two-component system response regulator
MEPLRVIGRHYVDVLSVEDNPADQILLRELLKKCQVECRLHFVKNGVEALDYLFRRGKFRSAARPDIILLDLNMPKKDGKAVLKEIKETPDLKAIPVLVLTTSSRKSDINATYKLHANTYMTKPVDLTKYESLLRAIEDYWFQHAQLPTRGEDSDIEF